MARVWLCAGGAGCLLAFLVLHSHLSGSPVLRDFVFQISWRTEDVLYRLDVGWPKHPEYFAGATFCVAVDSPNGLVYVAQRGDDVQKVLVFTEDGYFLRAWNHTVDTPHGMFAASTPQEPAVWITDVGSGTCAGVCVARAAAGEKAHLRPCSRSHVSTPEPPDPVCLTIHEVTYF
ncbi:NHL repeat containing 3 [Phyllostomus discolor]|uniref:NHL repeat containing 3 n=1 Tax=Phyllostomus discolor TaxID=89673 RepID=A0A833YTJ8_9CHIR|nr:NHL repeat containing 3 [Phyllostomus discolor]